MQHFAREKGMFIFVVMSLILLVLMLSITTKTITNVSAVGADGVGVYWDIDCTQERKEINWGNLTPGSVSESIIVYVQNEVEEPVYLIMNTTDWDPERARKYITLKWDYTYRRIDPDEVLQIKMRLSVSPSITEISDFSFDILITGSDRLPYDVDGDDKVSAIDMVLVLTHFGESRAQFPEGDVNNDGKVGAADLILIIVNYGAGG